MNTTKNNNEENNWNLKVALFVASTYAGLFLFVKASSAAPDDRRLTVGPPQTTNTFGGDSCPYPRPPDYGNRDNPRATFRTKAASRTQTIQTSTDLTSSPANRSLWSFQSRGKKTNLPRTELKVEAIKTRTRTDQQEPDDDQNRQYLQLIRALYSEKTSLFFQHVKTSYFLNRHFLENFNQEESCLPLSGSWNCVSPFLSGNIDHNIGKAHHALWKACSSIYSRPFRWFGFLFGLEPTLLSPLSIVREILVIPSGIDKKLSTPEFFEELQNNPLYFEFVQNLKTVKSQTLKSHADLFTKIYKKTPASSLERRRELVELKRSGSLSESDLCEWLRNQPTGFFKDFTSTTLYSVPSLDSFEQFLLNKGRELGLLLNFQAETFRPLYYGEAVFNQEIITLQATRGWSLLDVIENARYQGTPEHVARQKVRFRKKLCEFLLHYNKRKLYKPLNPRIYQLSQIFSQEYDDNLKEIEQKNLSPNELENLTEKITNQIFDRIENVILQNPEYAQPVLSLLYEKYRQGHQAIAHILGILEDLNACKELSRAISDSACKALQRKFPDSLGKTVSDEDFQFIQQLNYLASPGIFSEAGELQQIVTLFFETRFKQRVHLSDNPTLQSLLKLETRAQKAALLLESTLINYNLLRKLGVL